MKAARGQYILFIDQDDYYHPGSIAKVYEHLREHLGLDILVSDSAYQFKGHESNKLQLNLPYDGVCTGIEFLQRNGPALAPWRLAFNREFYVSHDLQFVERCRIEDVDWSFKVIYHARKIQYQKVLLVHYQKDEVGQTDNMYRNYETLKANTVAGCRTLDVANSLYAGTAAYGIVVKMAESFFNFTCRYLFGAYRPLRMKKELISLIPVKESQFRLVDFAVKHPTLFCCLTNLGIVPFRIARYFVRKVRARKLEGE